MQAVLSSWMTPAGQKVKAIDMLHLIDPACGRPGNTLIPSGVSTACHGEGRQPP